MSSDERSLEEKIKINHKIGLLIIRTYLEFWEISREKITPQRVNYQPNLDLAQLGDKSMTVRFLVNSTLAKVKCILVLFLSSVSKFSLFTSL